MFHEAGAAVLFCDERVLSSDEDEWEEWEGKSRHRMASDNKDDKTDKRCVGNRGRLADHHPEGHARDDHRAADRDHGPERIGCDGELRALRINERDLSPEHVMRLWINGYYFHAEPALEAELKGLAGPGEILSRHVFLDYIYRSLDAVIWTASVLQDAIDRDAIGA